MKGVFLEGWALASVRAKWRDALKRAREQHDRGAAFSAGAALVLLAQMSELMATAATTEAAARVIGKTDDEVRDELDAMHWSVWANRGGLTVPANDLHESVLGPLRVALQSRFTRRYMVQYRGTDVYADAVDEIVSSYSERYKKVAEAHLRRARNEWAAKFSDSGSVMSSYLDDAASVDRAVAVTLHELGRKLANVVLNDRVQVVVARVALARGSSATFASTTRSKLDMFSHVHAALGAFAGSVPRQATKSGGKTEAVI